ncbi:MAG TPA: Ig-like domain-containing protein [Patescibacteria group bacterium]|nr:Ig-like domain-containing protein [Patescibacteria group bacterium]
MKVGQKTKLIIILAGIVGVLLGLKLLLPPPLTPKIIRTDPADNQQNVYPKQTLKLTFDRPISTEGWQIIPFPSFEFSVKNDKETLEVIPKKELAADTQYKIEVKNSQDPSFYFTFSFKTVPDLLGPPPGGKTPSKEEVEKYYWDLSRKTYEAMPLFDYVPYKTENYWIGYTRPLTLYISLTKDTPEIRAEVLDWIRSKGVDPATHQIIWKLKK